MLTLTTAQFRTYFTAFANTTTYPDAAVEMNLDTAQMYISSDDYGKLAGTSREYAIYLMTAHLFAISDLIASGQTPGQVASSSIDKISVSLTPPPNKNHLHWWLSTTPYGAQLVSLLMVRAAGGFSVGGYAERANFRKPDGSF